MPNRQLTQFLKHSLLSLYATLMLGTRIGFTGRITFIFLVWNLFLAWIPYLTALMLTRVRGLGNNFLPAIGLLGIWLLFLPNAPYILTDLVHLKPRAGVPFWYDLALILSFAFTGLLLGWLSMLEVHRYIAKRLRPLYAWIFVGGTTLLCAFGIYLGRELRWNSWDMLRSPEAVLRDVAAPLLHPFANLSTICITLAFTGFLFMGYVVLRYIAQTEIEPLRLRSIDEEKA